MALSIEQQRKYARMLSPEQLANYVKNEDLGNEIGITPVVFAEAIAEINAEDKELQPVAPNTVMDREVTEMLGRGGRGLEGLMPEESMNPGMMPEESMNPGMMPQQFNRGGMIPGYQNGGFSARNDFLDSVLKNKQFMNSNTLRDAMVKTVSKGSGSAWNALAKKNLLGMLVTMFANPEKVGYSDEDREAFLRRPSYPTLDNIRETQGMEAAERARRLGGYSTGHDDQGMDFDKPSIWERIREMYQGPIGRAGGGIIPGYHSGGDIPTHAHGLNSDHRINEEPSEYYRKFLVSAPVDTRTTGDRVSGQGSPIISPSQDELDQWEKDKSERARSSTPRGTGVPPGWQPYVDLMQSGKIGEGWQRALEGSGPFTESPSFLERRNLGEKYFGLQSSSPVDQVTTTLDEMAKEQSGTGDFGGVEGARLRQLQEIPLTQKQENLFGILSGQQGSSKSGKNSDIHDGNEVAAEIKRRGDGGLPVDVPDWFTKHEKTIEGLIDAPPTQEQTALLSLLGGRTAISDEIGNIEGREEEEYQNYLTNRFYTALTGMGEGVGGSLVASDAAYTEKRDNTRDKLAGLRLQLEGQNIDTAGLAAEFSTQNDKYRQNLLDTQLAGHQEDLASKRFDDELEFRKFELVETLEAAIPTDRAQQLEMVQTLLSASENEALMSNPEYEGLNNMIVQRLSILLPILIGPSEDSEDTEQGEA